MKRQYRVIAMMLVCALILQNTVLVSPAAAEAISCEGVEEDTVSADAVSYDEAVYAASGNTASADGISENSAISGNSVSGEILLSADCVSAEQMSAVPAVRGHQDSVIKMADFILGLQCRNGAIRDCAGAVTANTDSNMEYALIGLGAAYQQTADRRYLKGLKKGIGWLARTECMSGSFKGSWWYACNVSGRHTAFKASGDVTDVRGVDTTSALFVYLLYLDKKLDPDSVLSARYRRNALAAMNFIEKKSRDEDGLTRSSFQRGTDRKWRIYNCKYSADQGDVYLGLQAAALLYDKDKYQPLADELKQKTESTFFSSDQGRYCVSIEDGTADMSVSDFGPIQSQGFLPWMWGSDTANDAAAAWLAGKVRSDGSLSCFDSDPLYAMSAAMYGLAMNGTGGQKPEGTYSWLLGKLFDSSSGGVMDSMAETEEDCNVAAFSIIALTGMLPFEQNRISGVTLNDITAVSINEVIAAADAMQVKPTVRIVMQPEKKASEYREALSLLHGHAFIMLCPCDSSYFSSYRTADRYLARFRECDRELADYVDIWEVGNEINGEGWLGISTKKAAAYMYRAWRYLHAKGYVTELTPYDFRSGDQSISMLAWLKKYVPNDMKKHVDHVLISYYDDDNGGVHDDWQETFDSLKKMFPNSYVGFGECGFSSPHACDNEFRAQVTAYYGSKIYNNRYEGGYFWWYWQEDCLPYENNDAWKCINEAIK